VKEASKPISSGSHVSVKTDLKSGQKLLIELGEVQAELKELHLLKSALGETVNESYRGEMQAQCDRLEDTIASLSAKTEQKVEQLNEADNKWTAVNQQMKKFSEQLIATGQSDPAFGVSKSIEEQIVDVEV